VAKVKSVLEFIQRVRKDPESPESLQKKALSHAQSIEAVCWFPHSRNSPEDYERLMTVKTHELCYVLLRNAFPNICFRQLFHRDPRPEEPRKVSLPIFPNQQESEWTFEFPGFGTEPIIPFEEIMMTQDDFLDE
jgi:hypothetical protein